MKHNIFTRRNRKKQPARPPVVYTLPRDLEQVKAQASTMGGMVVIQQHYPDNVITERSNIELAAHLVANRQMEWCQSQGKQLSNDASGYIQAFVQSFADAYQSMVIALERDPEKHAKYMQVFGEMSMGNACMAVLSHPGMEKEQVVI